MTHEETLILETGRAVKILAQKLPSDQIQIDVLVKEAREIAYHLPIGTTHPKYWKLKRLDEQKSRQMQIKYSGLSDKQLRKVVKGLTQESSKQI